MSGRSKAVVLEAGKKAQNARRQTCYGADAPRLKAQRQTQG